jgi:WD40 repeat protein
MIASLSYASEIEFHLRASLSNPSNPQYDPPHIVTCVCFGPNEKMLVSATDDIVSLWDMTTMKQVKSLNGGVYPVSSIAFTPRGDTLATTGYPEHDGDHARIQFWDVATGTKTSTMRINDQWVVRSLAYRPDGKALASGMTDGTIRLWDTEAGVSFASLRGHKKGVLSVAFDAAGRFLVSGSQDTTIRLWDSSVAWRDSAVLRGHGGPVFSVAFNPTGRAIASGSDDKTVRVWDVASHKCIAVFRGHSGTVYAVAFSPDGRTLASCSLDKTIRLWDVAATSSRLVIHNADAIASVAYSRDGKTFVTGDFGGSVKLWNVITNRHRQREQTIGERDRSPPSPASPSK